MGVYAPPPESQKPSIEGNLARSRLSGSGECLKQDFLLQAYTARHAGGNPLLHRPSPPDL